MATQPPQVLSRRANGAPATATGPANEPSKGKGSHGGGPQGRSARSKGANGKSGEATKNANEGDTPKPAKSKAHHEGEKLVIRRLPPGLTQQEFMSILGADWEPGKGKVDWLSYAPGKVSNDPSKPSRPSRAYVHVMKKDDIMPLSDAVRNSKWEDAKATFNNPSLIGPPSVEFAIYKKVPSNKKRTDARQGTIDQDPEFMAFLEELANPAPPKETTEADYGEDAAKPDTKVTTTPLVEYLKEKKANKGKESGSKGKGESRKGKGGIKDEESGKKKGKDSKTEKAPKEKVKILTKKAAAEQQAAEAAKAAAATQSSTANAQETAPKSRRAGIAAAARILQRDLGLSPGSAHRKARQDAAKADADAKSTPAKETAPATTERPASPAKSDAPASTQKNRAVSTSAPKAQAGRRAKGGKNAEKNKPAEGATSQPTAANPPVVLLKKKAPEEEAAQPVPAASTSQPQSEAPKTKQASNNASGAKGASNKGAPSQKKTVAVSPGATRGFVKHANPSQGVTEALLKQALEIHGTITFVEIDKRKGFAYVDFSDHEGLVKAVSASPVTVAQGTVQVLERKEKKPAAAAAPATATAPAPAPAPGSGSTPQEKPSGRGRRGRGGGGKANASTNGQAAAPAAANTNSGGG